MLKPDTIAAIATAIAPDQGSVGIVRLSGSKSEAIARQLFHTKSQIWSSHRLFYGQIKHPQTAEVIDECLMLIMKAPRSFTREDVIEFQCHGGIMPVQRVLELCLDQGARLAEPGEFSLRAFLNGRIDLTQAESVQELVGAKSPQAAQVAIAGLQGKLANPIRQMRQQCIAILAEIEARLDFDDELIPLDLGDLSCQLQALLQLAEGFMATAERGQLLRRGLKIAIIGRPNVGKSSLLNAWSQSERAIVTNIPGTTRDVIDAQLVVGGIPVTVLDTAGIRATQDMVEKIGVERSLLSVKSADLVLLVIDATVGWHAAEGEIYQLIGDRPLIIVINKTDLSPPPPLPPNLKFLTTVTTAAASCHGIDQLETAILASVHQNSLKAANLEVAINQRQKASLQQAIAALTKLQEAIELPLDFWTIDLRDAIHALGQITGEEITESVLETIFQKFCIGK